ncbi:SipW-dependent-type signal peptide-containing protein [Yaniella halotolerans]|uniref:SipW-dependent-type signal peptide-containing protein n=1 Tax=Yaniella halotolerans TaxID=225453 RepID=UPI0003B52F6B|nr:SipW-dependent-type signal peptide-containing protein [Yaniella halotolerans]
MRTKRSVALISGAAVVGAALGIGGTTMALWNDSVPVETQMQSGFEYFAAGAGDNTVVATDGTVEFTVGATEAAQLLEDREFAVALQTESISQGNAGLTYAIDEPDWGDHIFGAAETKLFRIDFASECSVDSTENADAATQSTPVEAEYSDTTEPNVEYWCFVADLEALPVEGDYSSSATVTAESDDGVTVEDTSEWNAKVTRSMDPAKEPDHTITFSYETVRAEVTL